MLAILAIFLRARLSGSTAIGCHIFAMKRRQQRVKSGKIYVAPR